MVPPAALLFDIGDDAVNIPSAHDVCLSKACKPSK